MDNLRNLAMKYDADGKEISGIADSGAMMTPVPEGSAVGETMMTPVPAYGAADGTMMTPVSVDGAGVTEMAMTLLPDGGTADMSAEDTAAEPVYTGVMARGRKQEEFEEGGRAPFAYLEEEQNLNFPAFSAETVDEDAPLTSFQIAGKWLRQAADLRNYWALLENFGAQAAEYKWAYDEGKFGTFEAGAFGRELLKAGARGLGANTLRTAGNVLSMFGANLESRNAGTAAVTAGAGLLVPETGKIFKNIGDKLGEYAGKIENSELLAPAAEAYSADPNWSKLANVLGQGSSQVLAMGTMAKFIGSGPTYGLFAGGGAGEIFKESYAKDGDIDTANTLALISGGTTFAIDKLFSPLPKQIEKDARITSKMIAREIAGAPLREAGTEVLQQMMAENLVRKVGIDDTQDLFEGLIESALGAIAGSSALMAADGSVYYARKTYEDARQRMLLRGVTAEEIELYKNNMMELLKSKPDAFGKVLNYVLERNLQRMSEGETIAQGGADAATMPEGGPAAALMPETGAATAGKSTAATAESGADAENATVAAKRQNRSLAQVRQDVKGFRRLFDEVYKRSLKATGDTGKARIAAGMMQANMMALYEIDGGFSPASLFAGQIPEYKQLAYQEFQKRLSPEAAVMFQFGGVEAKFADFKKLAEAYKLEQQDYSPRLIWSRTGWYRGGDGRWRFEINDSGAKLKINTDVKADDLPKRYWQTYIRKLEEMEGHDILGLRKYEEILFQDRAIIKELYNYLYSDFIDFLDKHYQRNMAVGLNRSGYFEFRDLEGDFEAEVKAQRALADSRLYALSDGYGLKEKEQRDSQIWNRMPIYLKDKSLKEVLIDRGELVIPDGGENGTAANRNGEAQSAEDGSYIQKTSPRRSRVKSRVSDREENGYNVPKTSPRRDRLQIRVSDREENSTPFFDNVEAVGENVKSEKEKKYIEISRTDFRNGMPDEVLATVSDKVYQTKNEADFAEKMEELLVSYRGRKIYNPSLGREVEIRSSSIGKYKSLWGDDNKKLLVPYLPLLLGTAVFTNMEKTYDVKLEPNVRAYHKAYFPVMIDGELINSRMTVKEDDKGDLFWDLRLEDVSRKEIEDDLRKSTGEVISYDDYLAEQRRKAEELAKSRRSPWLRKTASNDNFPAVDRFYTKEQMKVIRSTLEETKYLEFLEKIWKDDTSVEKNFQTLREFLDVHEAATPELFEYQAEVGEELLERVLKRRKAAQRMGIPEGPELYMDLNKELAYRTYLAAQGDYHKPYRNMAYRPDFYREAHTPRLMSDLFFNQEKYRYLLPAQKVQIAEMLDKVHRIYRLHRETEFARKAEQRDIRAANAYIAEHYEGGDESLRRYWEERQLLLERKEVRLGDLLEHQELYRNYPDMEDVMVRFEELANDEGYHFYHDKTSNTDVLEIDPRQFDYANLKDLLLRGAAFAIQMREGFDPALTPTQRRNFMDRHIHMARKEIAPVFNKELTAFLGKYLPGEKQRDYLVEREVPLPLLGLYRSEAKSAAGQQAGADTAETAVSGARAGGDAVGTTASDARVGDDAVGTTASEARADGNKPEILTYREIDFDRLYEKLNERYGSAQLDPDERQIGDFAYSALQNLREAMNSEILTRARMSSGYAVAAPFPWGGVTSQGNIDVRAMLRRQDYSDWQRSFSYWDEKNLPPPTDRTRLTYADLEKIASNFDKDIAFKPDFMRSVPDDETAAPTPQKRLKSTLDVLAKGAFDAADKTLYLFETADAETIVHETFHYLSQILKSPDLNGNMLAKRAYYRLMDNYRKELLHRYEPVNYKGGYMLVYKRGERVMPELPRRFSTPEAAIEAGVEEMFVQRFMDAIGGRLTVERDSEQLLHNFYIVWLDKVTKLLDLTPAKTGSGGKQLFDAVGNMLGKAGRMLKERYKPEK